MHKKSIKNYLVNIQNISNYFNNSNRFSKNRTDKKLRKHYDKTEKVIWQKPQRQLLKYKPKNRTNYYNNFNKYSKYSVNDSDDHNDYKNDEDDDDYNNNNDNIDNNRDYYIRKKLCQNWYNNNRSNVVESEYEEIQKLPKRNLKQKVVLKVAQK